MSKLSDSLATAYELTADYTAGQSHEFRLSGAGTLSNSSLAVVTIIVTPCANTDDRKAKEDLTAFEYVT